MCCSVFVVCGVLVDVDGCCCLVCAVVCCLMMLSVAVRWLVAVCCLIGARCESLFVGWCLVAVCCRSVLCVVC